MFKLMGKKKSCNFTLEKFATWPYGLFLLVDDSHEMSYLIFSEKTKKKNLSSSVGMMGTLPPGNFFMLFCCLHSFLAKNDFRNTI